MLAPLAIQLYGGVLIVELKILVTKYLPKYAYFIIQLLLKSLHFINPLSLLPFTFNSENLPFGLIPYKMFAVPSPLLYSVLCVGP